MPAKRKKEKVICQHYHWLLGKRSGVFFADGRANHPHNVGATLSAHAIAMKP